MLTDGVDSLGKGRLRPNRIAWGGSWGEFSRLLDWKFGGMVWDGGGRVEVCDRFSCSKGAQLWNWNSAETRVLKESNRQRVESVSSCWGWKADSLKDDVLRWLEADR